MTEVRFMVRGLPQTKGSARAFTYRRSVAKGGGIGARVDNDNPKAKAWQADVAKSAWVARGGGRRAPHAGAVHLTVNFFLPKPQKPKDDCHVTKPDLDKLLRCLIDGLTGVLFVDDSQVTGIVAGKFYARTSEAGADVIVRPVVGVSPLLKGLA